ncbi:hypothetical protein, partial [Zobellella endophytica]|uniref:hypothetical protein n=1 Tax=Zobellella endophytica TaxID=2116700 RepID=UPI001B308AA4
AVLLIRQALRPKFLPLVTAAGCAVSVDAHYRQPRFLRKGFFDIFMKKGDFGHKISQNRLLLMIY